MRQKQSHSENHGKGEANVERPLTKTEAKKAMARFEAVSRNLLKVTPNQLLQEERKWRDNRERERDRSR
jgi:hypothetical protein